MRNYKKEEIKLYETIRNLGEDGKAIKGLSLKGKAFLL